MYCIVILLTIDEGPQIEYSCSGTPADCVKMAKNEYFKSENQIYVFQELIMEQIHLLMLFIQVQ